MKHEPVEAPEEGGEGLAGAGGSKDQGAFAARDDRPAQALRGGGCIEDGPEPLGGDGMETGKRVYSRLPQNRSRRCFRWIRFRIGLGRAPGHAS